MDVLTERQSTHNLRLTVQEQSGGSFTLHPVKFTLVYPEVQTDDLTITLWHHLFEAEPQFGQHRISIFPSQILWIDEVTDDTIDITIEL
jgi:hypothetical protein